MATPVRYVIGEAYAKWVIVMTTLRVPATSVETVRFGVAASVGGVIYNPTAATFEAAFLTSAGPPAPGDWKAGTWDITLIGTYAGQVLVGTGTPAGAYPAGEYDAWVRITDVSSGETVIRPVGQVIFQ